MDRIELAPGYDISRIIKGGWQLAGGHGAIDRKRAVEDMARFVEAGITTFDCADIYTGVEELIGEFLREYRTQRGAAAARNVQVHTKLVPDLDALATINREQTARAIDRSLRRLGVERLDLVQFHWWDYEVPRFVEVASYLKELQRAGKVRYIGATNFEVAALRQMVDAGVPLVAHQVQYSVVDRRPENGMVDFCRGHGISLLCYGGVGGGFFSERYLDATEPEEPLENRSLTKYKLIIDEFGGWSLFQELLRTLSSIAKKYGRGIAAVAIAYVLQKPGVAAVIVGARNAGHMASTLGGAGIKLDQEDLWNIEKALEAAKGPAGDTYGLERGKGGRHASIMKYNLNQLAKS